MERIEELLALGSREAASELRDLAEATSEKEQRKAARKALYLLSQKGILPFEKAAVVASPAKVAAPTEGLQAYASTFDGAGNFLLFFLIPSAEGGSPLFARFVLNDSTGIHDGASERLPKREIPARLEVYETQLEEGLALAEIEADYGRWLLEEGRALTREVGKQTPTGFLELAPRIGTPQQEYTEFTLPAPLTPEDLMTDAEISHDPNDLFDLAWFSTWFYETEEVYPWLKKMAQLRQELGEEATAEVTQERRSAIEREAMTALMPLEVRECFIRRLAHSADILFRRGKVVEAKQAFYQALDLARETPAVEVPFAQILFARSLAVTLQFLKREQEQRKS